MSVAPEQDMTSAQTGHGRHSLVDALRGLALLGILVVNIEFIVQPSEIGWLHYNTTIDRLVRWFVFAFGQTKVYPLFAMLFGYGLSLQLASARRRRSELAPRYRRRMIGMAILGVFHGVLFFLGDILVLYAAIGGFAYRFREVGTRKLLRLATIVYGLAAIVWIAIGALDVLGDGTPPTAAADAVATLANGSWSEVISLQFWYWLVTLAILTVVQGPAVFASFLVGIALGRTDVLARPGDHVALFRRVLCWAPLAIAGASLGAALLVIGGRWETLGFAIGFAIAPGLTATYIALLALVLANGRRWLSSLLEASGRMSLTVYLLESVILSTMSYGYGFGLFTHVAPTAGVLLAIAVWISLSVFSFVWMRAFRFGPFEFGLRWFTYGECP